MATDSATAEHADESGLPEGLWRVDGSASNTFLVRDGAARRAASSRTESDDGDGTDAPLYLVDAGVPGDAGAIRAAVSNAGYDLGDVDGVLLTHYDYDHVGSLANLPELDCPVYAAEPDASFLDGTETPELTPHKAFIQRVGGVFTDRPDLPVERVADGDTVGSFTAYHTPGHGPGHLAWISADRGVAFLGDLVREDAGELEPSTWLISYDTGAVRDSVRDLDDRAPDFATACVGHGDPITPGGREALASLAASLRE
ncbi:MBL fold metallo-hydrolase [Halobaculum lipolyticum]|uniref:MBL fold metallo-hydrolase n=1 Tax=Halobaculum lipolyticum TaxID=3032001 RepID=A0ABD5W970_9EURY|nr:MBL fold metallo-hydrolase [Halobaculum sp. DT31]